ncbi:MAG TPA: Nif3-like dinuclear metal center hexameric protein [Phycisphaerae bacterium]|nr:Nif3-like dinuclear metal center hexameric protein [Phycisphaerae bacterium]
MAAKRRAAHSTAPGAKQAKRGRTSTNLARKLPVLTEVCAFLEQIAPLNLAEQWDKVGLVSAPTEPTLIERILVALDLTTQVRNEALKYSVDLLICYHPPLFKPLEHLRADGHTPAALAVELSQHGVWIYSPHTALDAAQDGTNDALAAVLNLKVTGSLIPRQAAKHVKLVTFVPEADVEKVATAVFDAGAGHIGIESRYSQCSFRTPGTGTFFGDESTSPAVGVKGQLEFVREIRFETVVPVSCLDQVVLALRQAHPYEEPAFDLLTMETLPQAPGLGRIAELDKPLTLRALAENCKRRLQLSAVRTIGNSDSRIARAAVLAGSCGLLPLENRSGKPFDCVITGELKHHDALSFAAAGISAILLGHGESEKPVLSTLKERLAQQFPATNVQVSRAGVCPFEVV